MYQRGLYGAVAWLLGIWFAEPLKGLYLEPQSMWNDLFSFFFFFYGVVGHLYLLPKFRLDLNLLHKAFRAVFRAQALRDKNQTWKTWHIGAFPDCSDSKKGTPIFFWKPSYLRIEALGPQVLG